MGDLMGKKCLKHQVFLNFIYWEKKTDFYKSYAMAAPSGLSHLITSTFLSPKRCCLFPSAGVLCPCHPPLHRTPMWPVPVFCALPAAADVLPTTGGDPKAPRAGGPAGSPGQTVGTGDQKLADGLREVLSRDLCPPCPQGHHSAPW